MIVQHQCNSRAMLVGAKSLKLAKALISLWKISRDIDFYEGTAQILEYLEPQISRPSRITAKYGHCHSRNEYHIRRWLVAETCSQLHLVSSFEPMNI